MLKNKILAIESSCDETACAVIENGNIIRSNVVSTQISIHEKFGGVVPEVASRKHLEYMPLIIDEALAEADCSLEDMDAVAVTFGPGLVGALLVGVSSAKALACAAGLPLIGVHHIEGHIYANFLENPTIPFPCLCLVVSGGHTNIIRIDGHGQYLALGKTLDDAAGEAFDKVARSLGLAYPGGPLIDALAKEGNPDAIKFPRAKLDNPYDFSFSGLKSAVLNYLNQAEMKDETVNKTDVAASFQKAVLDVLIQNTMLAMENEKIDTLLLAGGVSANSGLRQGLEKAVAEKGKHLYYPSLKLCTDNAAMIGTAAAYKYEREEFADWSLNAIAQLPFSDYVSQSKK